MTSAARARCSCSAPRSSLRHRRRHRGAEAVRRAVRGARPGRLRRGRTGARQGARQDSSAACRLPGDETGDCKMFTEQLAAARCRARRHVPLRRDDRAAGRRGRPHRVASRPARAASPPTPMWWRSAAIRRCCCGRSAFRRRSIRSRAIRSPCRSPMPPARRNRPSWTRPTRWRSPGSASASASAARPKSQATICACTTARRATLEHSVGDLFPDGGDLSRASFWCGLRPMTPDGPPIIGGTRYANLYPQHRSRHAGLDHGVRIGPGAGRHHVGTKAGDRRRRAWHIALRVRSARLRQCRPALRRPSM